MKQTGTTSKGSILLIATFSSFLVPFISSSINVALPSIGNIFSLDAVILSWIANSFLLAAAIILIPIGRIADIFGQKRIFLYGAIIYTLSSFLSSISISALILIVLRVIQGMGAGMILGTSVAILTSVYPAGERGKVLGINATATYIGVSLGPVVGGLLVQQFGWGSIFVVNGLAGLVTVILALLKLGEEWAGAKGEKFDLVGSIIYGIALLVTMYGFSLLPDFLGILLVVIGLIGLLIFLFWEIRNNSPVLNVNLFRNNISFSLSNLAALTSYISTFSVSFLLSLYLQYIKALSPSYTGLILVSQPVIMVMISPIAGRLSDKIKPRIVASIGMLLTTAGLTSLSFLNNDTGLWFIVFSLVVLGIGFAFFSSPNANAVMSSVDKRSYGIASGTLGTMRLLGQTISMGIAMVLFSIFIGRVQITVTYFAAFLIAIKAAFIIFAVLCFSGIFASLASGK